MAKSKYAEQLSRGKAIIDDLRDGQIGRLGRASNAGDRERTLADWEDLAGAEAAVKERYQGRFLFELIQNANDAIVEYREQHGRWPDNRDILIELHDNSLLVANGGQPFARDNIESLCRLHKSTKTHKQIGHKGIGFKSVLEISATPEVYSGEFAFGYDGAQVRRDVEQVMGQRWQDKLPVLRAPYPRHVNQLPPDDRDRIDALLDDLFVTVVRLPFNDAPTRDQIAERMRQDVQPTLLLFMPAIEQIHLRYPDGEETIYWKSQPHQPLPGVSVTTLHVGERDVHSHWLMLGPVERPLTDRSLVADLEGDAWKDVTALRFSVTIPLQDSATRLPRLGDKSQLFYVYFPTEEFSGLSFAVHGDFYVGDDRKTIPLNRLNKWLIDEICQYVAGDGMALLKQVWPDGETLIDVLAPITQPERGFPRHFMDTYLHALSMAAFVPTDGGHYRTPEEIAFPPVHADEATFRQLFPASKLRGDAKWAYATPQVIAVERKRKQPFLLSDALGAQTLSADSVLDALQQGGMPPIDEGQPLIAFLADWYDKLPRAIYPVNHRQEFRNKLRQLAILPTTEGWTEPGQRIFQANLRQEEDAFAVPRGFEFSVLRRDYYPKDNATKSVQFAFFDALDVREYAIRDIVRDIILPPAIDETRFARLRAEHPGADLAVYRLLKRFFADDRSKGDFADRLAQVLLPAHDGKTDGWRGWKPAGELYFGRNWPGGEQLEQLYAAFDDCYFLGALPGLEMDATAHEEWTRFFQWLGVHNRPRLIALDDAISCNGERFEGAKVMRSPRFEAYLARYREQFVCHHSRATAHGFSRRLHDACRDLHHFEDLVQQGDAPTLRILLTLVAGHWSDYESELHATLRCLKAQYCATETVDSYLFYLLKELPWISAAVGDTFVSAPPAQIWLLGETEPAAVRTLVLTLAPDLSAPLYRSLTNSLNFITSGSAQIEDYVRLIERLPAHYALERADLDDKGLSAWQGSVRTVFNWACERIQTGLVNRGEDAPPYPAGLQVLAYRGSMPVYVAIDRPELVYPDDNAMAERWSAHCVYLRINDDWTRLRNWLRVAPLSAAVESSWEIGEEISAESARLQERYQRTLPYFLALIRSKQPSTYERMALPRLRRLQFHVVKELTVREQLTPLPQCRVSSDEDVYLRKNDIPISGGATVARTGDMYVSERIASNYDPLGDYIADYIEIARIGDAFTILIHRDSVEERLRYLQSKGVNREAVQEVIVLLDEDSADPDSREALSGLEQAIREQLFQTGSETAGGTDDVDDVPSSAGTNGRQIPSGAEIPFSDDDEYEDDPTFDEDETDYPDLDLDAAPDNVDQVLSDQVVDETSGTGSGNGAGAGTGQVSDKARRVLGERGERWAYVAERKRLAELGFDPDELEEMEELLWVSRKRPTANYDIRSIDIDAAGRQHIIYIEVKASAGTQRRIHISREEFRFALEQGDCHRLYWVGNADKAVPNVPASYTNIAALVIDKRIELHLRQFAMTLPQPASSRRKTNQQAEEPT